MSTHLNDGPLARYAFDLVPPLRSSQARTALSSIPLPPCVRLPLIRSLGQVGQARTEKAVPTNDHTKVGAEGCVLGAAPAGPQLRMSSPMARRWPRRLSPSRSRCAATLLYEATRTTTRPPSRSCALPCYARVRGGRHGGDPSMACKRSRPQVNVASPLGEATAMPWSAASSGRQP